LKKKNALFVVTYILPGLKPTQLHGGPRVVGTLSLKNSIVDLEKEQVHCSGYSTFCFVPSYLSIPIHWQSKVVDLVNTLL
jgi:hypothetical protein